ncbi:hypothetical protein DVK85_08535 [Flavobacterium arcticum]|uniref:Uncharacterized protein n=1 Tax=Flavobacterium arcticum TaxID=1784713 RepID=A0A345HCG7_9FLAO|nr:hypothetical protein [Flavobacterium arcticum]AXG74277.1 hypothetical protein DVK85_08535 [Flavobacterium arcticum]KAF2508133.1 hypothetical protein E0W72_10775 [Flavobacterium arcticum]
MKTIRALFFIYIFSYAVAIGSTFINNNLIVSYNIADRVLEAAFVSIPIFIALTLLYAIIRLIIITIKAVKNKKPSCNEDFDG